MDHLQGNTTNKLITISDKIVKVQYLKVATDL